MKDKDLQFLLIAAVWGAIAWGLILKDVIHFVPALFLYLSYGIALSMINKAKGHSKEGVVETIFTGSFLSMFLGFPLYLLFATIFSL